MTELRCTCGRLLLKFDSCSTGVHIECKCPRCSELVVRELRPTEVVASGHGG